MENTSDNSTLVEKDSSSPTEISNNWLFGRMNIPEVAVANMGVMQAIFAVQHYSSGNRERAIFHGLAAAFEIASSLGMGHIRSRRASETPNKNE